MASTDETLIKGNDMTQRITAFIDGYNLQGMAKAIGLEIDYKRLLEYIEGDDMLIRANYYACVPTDTEQYSPVFKVLDWLSYNGFNIIRKKIRTYDNEEGTKTKSSIVVEMATDMIQSSNHSDCIVLFSGDGDLRYAIEHIQRTTGAYVVVFGDLKHVSDDLRRQADKFVDLKDIQGEICKEIKAENKEAA